MSEHVREPAAVRAANGTVPPVVEPVDVPVVERAVSPVVERAVSPVVERAEAPVATDAALRTAVRAAAEVAELVRDPAIRRVRLTVADVLIEVERAEAAPAREVGAVPGLAVAADGMAVAAAPGVTVVAGGAAVDGAAAAVVPVAGAAAPLGGTVAVTAPLMGVFYRCPGPDQPPFADVGQRVEAGDQVAIVEAMKMMNPVVTDRGGIVRAVHVTDGEVVEYDQPLLSIEPG